MDGPPQVRPPHARLRRDRRERPTARPPAAPAVVPHIGRFFGTNRSELTTPLRRYYAQGNHWFPPIGDDSMIRASYSRVIRDEHCPGCGATLAVKWLSGALDVAEAILDQAPREITTTDVHRVRQVLTR